MEFTRILEEGDLEKIKAIDIKVLKETVDNPVLLGAYSGNVEVVKYLHEKDCNTWCAELFRIALLNFDSEMLEYLHKINVQKTTECLTLGGGNM